MEILIICTFIIVGLILFGIEVFLIPGISVAGIAAGASIVYAVYYAFSHLGILSGCITIGISVAGVVGVIIWFMRSRTIDKLSLKSAIDYRPNPLEGIDLKPGDKGVTVTRLTLIGRADFQGNLIEVHSQDGFIDEKTPVRIVRIAHGTVYVQATDSSLKTN